MTGITFNGIQQIGLGTTDAKETFDWYRRYLGFDIRVFEDEATADLMSGYTGGQARRRHALLAMNLNGGGGLEVWQHLSPQRPMSVPEIEEGDIGINAMRIRAIDIQEAHDLLRPLHLPHLGEIFTDEVHRPSFHFTDPDGNRVIVIADGYRFAKAAHAFGGLMGATIGVSDMSRSVRFYKEVLGYTITAAEVRADEAHPCHRILLQHPKDRKAGGFSNLLGPTEIELVQRSDDNGKMIGNDRHWGDPGYIHLCIDVAGMSALGAHCALAGHPFTVDSSTSFDMGEAAGHFSYIEDPDGTLIEFVETHEVPLIKKLGISISMKKRDPHRPLPDWLVKSMRIHRVR